MNGVDDAARALLAILNLEDTIANDGNRYAIVQRDRLHTCLAEPF